MIHIPETGDRVVFRQGGQVVAFTVSQVDDFKVVHLGEDLTISVSALRWDAFDKEFSYDERADSKARPSVGVTCGGPMG